MKARPAVYARPLRSAALGRALVREGPVIALTLLLAAALAYGVRVLVEPDATRWSGRTASEWAARLGSPAPETRDSAIVALAALEPTTRRTLGAAAAMLADPSGNVANAAIEALLAARDKGANALQLAIERTVSTLRAPGALGRINAAQVLRAIGGRAFPATPDLMETLTDTNASVRAAMVSALGGILEGAGQQVDARIVAAAVDRLSSALQDQSPFVREAAVEALFRIIPEDPRLSLLLQAMLRDSSADVRERADATMALIERRYGRLAP